MKRRSWTEEQFREAVGVSKSIRQVIQRLGLREAGGNYRQFFLYAKEYNVDTRHFLGKAWNKGMKGIGMARISLEEILKKNSTFQSYKLKKRLIQHGLKKAACELCGWRRQSPDGRIPLELDHINGDSTDNRLVNLRILCPNCHSLQPTHRGLNRKRRMG